jgi:membrane protein required for colicin V production
MATVDIILIVLLGLGAVKGYMKGFVVEVFSLLAFFIGLFIAIEFTTPVALKYFGDHQWFHVISIGLFFGLFLAITIIINIVAKIIKKGLDLTFFGTFDNFFGAILGIFKWALIISVVFWMFRAVGISLPKEYVADSSVFPVIAAIGPLTFEYVSMLMPFFKDIFDSMEQFERKADFV